MLTAYGLGLGTCWIGFAQGYLNTPEGKQALGIPADVDARGADHRGPSEDGARARRSQGAGHPLGRLSAPVACG